MTAKELNDELNTDENKKPDYSAILIRLLYTFLFALLGWLSLWVLAAVIILQFGFWVFEGEKNQRLHDFAGQLTAYLKNVLDFVTLQKEQKPFPFSPWPEHTKASENTDA